MNGSRGSARNVGGLLNVMPESVGAQGGFPGPPGDDLRTMSVQDRVEGVSGTAPTWAPGIHRARSLRWLPFSGSRAVMSASTQMMVMTCRGMPVRLGAAR